MRRIVTPSNLAKFRSVAGSMRRFGTSGREVPPEFLRDEQPVEPQADLPDLQLEQALELQRELQFQPPPQHEGEDLARSLEAAGVPAQYTGSAVQSFEDERATGPQASAPGGSIAVGDSSGRLPTARFTTNHDTVMGPEGRRDPEEVVQDLALPTGVESRNNAERLYRVSHPGDQVQFHGKPAAQGPDVEGSDPEVFSRAVRGGGYQEYNTQPPQAVEEIRRVQRGEVGGRPVALDEFGVPIGLNDAE